MPPSWASSLPCSDGSDQRRPLIKINIRVKPGSSRPRVGGRHDGSLIVAVSARAVDGKATSEALTAVAKAVGCRRREVSLVSGETSRTKIIELPDDCRSTIAALLAG